MNMATSANSGSQSAMRMRGAAGWLGLAASPTFAVMAWIAAHDAPAMALCSAGSGVLPVGGMTAMYLLMSVFHLSPWLKLVPGRPRQRTCPISQNQGD
jgi:hypothetical protein